MELVCDWAVTWVKHFKIWQLVFWEREMERGDKDERPGSVGQWEKPEPESKKRRKFLSVPGLCDFISFFLPQNKLPQMLLLKITHIYYLIVSIGQKSRHNLAGFSASGFDQDTIQELAMAVVSSRLDWGEICFRAPYLIDRIHFLCVVELKSCVLADCWPAGHSQLLEAAHSSLPHDPLHRPTGFSSVP